MKHINTFESFLNESTTQTQKSYWLILNDPDQWAIEQFGHDMSKMTPGEKKEFEQFQKTAKANLSESEYVNQDILVEGDVNYKTDKFALVSKGGSIGSIANYPVFISGKMGSIIETGNDKEALKEKAKRMTKSLSPGERKYYGVGYAVIEIKPSTIKQIDYLIDLQKSSDNTEV